MKYIFLFLLICKLSYAIDIEFNEFCIVDDCSVAYADEEEEVYFRVSSVDLIKLDFKPDGAQFLLNTFHWVPSHNQSGNYTLLFMTDTEEFKIDLFVVNTARTIFVNDAIQWTFTAQGQDAEIFFEGLPKNATVEVINPLRKTVHWIPTNSGIYEFTQITRNDAGEDVRHLKWIVDSCGFNDEQRALDFNKDCNINIIDFVMLASHWLESAEI